MKYLISILVVGLLSSCSVPNNASQTLEDGEVRTVYFEGDREITALEYISGFKFGRETYNAREFSKVPEEERIQIRHNLSQTEYESLPGEMKELLPLEAKGTGMSEEDAHQEFLAHMRRMTPEGLSDLSLESRLHLFSGLTDAEVLTLTSGVQSLIKSDKLLLERVMNLPILCPTRESSS
jgi:hypothetical protein